MRHRWQIDEREYRRHEVRRGRRHAYERIVAQRTALVVVDLVPFFVDEMPTAAAIVAPVNELAHDVRALGGAVAWVVPASDLEVDPEFYGHGTAAAYRASGGRGPVTERLAPGLEVCPGDVVAEKSASSAFFPGCCDLDGMLRGRDIDTVMIAGAVANVCCESSARDASTLGYRVIMLADAVAAPNDAVLNATLTTIYRSFGDVRPIDDVVAALRSEATG